jgi:hypothetical protein
MVYPIYSDPTTIAPASLGATVIAGTGAYILHVKYQGGRAIDDVLLNCTFLWSLSASLSTGDRKKTS